MTPKRKCITQSLILWQPNSSGSSGEGQGRWWHHAYLEI